MKKYAVTTIAALAIMALVTPLYASGDMNTSSNKQQENNAAMDMQGQKQHQQNTAMEGQAEDMGHLAAVPSADELRGMEVFSQKGEEIGNIEEVAINDQTGEVRYVTLSKGGILGIGDEEIPLPLAALNFENDRAILTVDTSKLENAPQQANASDDQFQQDLQSHYGVSPAWQDNSKQDTFNMDNKKKNSNSMETGVSEDATSPDLKSKSKFDDSEKKRTKEY